MSFFRIVPSKYIIYVYSFVIFLGLVGVAYAAFSDKADVLGSSFSVGSADIKLILDLSGPVVVENMSDQLQGPIFTGISSGWSKEYVLKLFNNAPASLSLSTNANYLTSNDPQDLRSILYVEIFDWNDSDSDGRVDADEKGTSYGRKTIVKWKTEGFNLGILESGKVRGLILNFSADAVSDTKQGATGSFDFIFNSAEIQ